MKRSPLVIILVTIFIDLLGFGLVIPLLSVYAEELHATGWQIGLLTGIFSLMQFLFAPIWGKLSDRIGRRPVIFISLAGSVLGYALLAFANSFWLLLIARTVDGISGATVGVAQAYVADVTTPENRAKGMGLIGAAFGLGFTFGPALGGLLSQHDLVLGSLTVSRYGVPALVTCAMTLLNLLLAFFILPESRPERDTSAPATARPGRWDALRETLAHADLRLVLGLSLLVTVAFSMNYAVLPLLAKNRMGYDTLHVGLIFTVLGLVGAIIQGGLLGKLSRRFGEARLAVVGGFALAAGLFTIPFAHGTPILAVGLVLVAIGSAFTTPTLATLLSRLTSADRQGSVLGIGQSISSLGRFIGPVVGGVLYAGDRLSLPFFGGGLIAAGAALWSLRLWDVRVPTAQPAPTVDSAT